MGRQAGAVSSRYRRMWNVLKDSHGIKVAKAKAHKSEKDCNNDPLQSWLRKGNVAAGRYVKACARYQASNMLDIQRQTAHVKAVK